MNDTDTTTATLMAGVPATSKALLHRLRFSVGDPVAWIDLPDATGGGGGRDTLLIVRDIEMQRARRHARADRVACPADYAPVDGLSGDRETATAQAAAECLRRAGVRRVVADRTLPLIFAHYIERAGIAVECDPQMGVMDRRRKDAQELAWLREAQTATERLMRSACEWIAAAGVNDAGELVVEGEPLTSERVRRRIAVEAMEAGYSTPGGSIVAGGPTGADCHDAGAGVLRTAEPIIVDIYPRCEATGYHGDCTRTVVHGPVIERVGQMHAAVVEAKAAATAAVRAGVTGERVHEAALALIRAAGFAVGLPGEGDSAERCAMTHGTGHGIGLDVHEPPLLDRGGPELVVGDVLTIEPGLYCPAVGGVRVENMVAVTASGCDDFNLLGEGLTWG